MKCMFQDCPFDSTKIVPCEIGTTGEHVDVHVCKFHYDVFFDNSISVSMELKEEEGGGRRMNKIDCYKCNREPSAECGECPIWLADEEVSEKERIAFQQGAKDFAEWLPQHFDLRFSNNSDIWLDEFFNHTRDKVLAEWQKGNDNE